MLKGKNKKKLKKIMLKEQDLTKSTKPEAIPEQFNIE